MGPAGGNDVATDGAAQVSVGKTEDWKTVLAQRGDDEFKFGCKSPKTARVSSGFSFGMPTP